MSTDPLDILFNPASVAVVGASPRVGLWGGVVLRCLQQGGCKGTLHAVNPKHDSVLGVPCLGSLKALGAAPDLVIVTIPAHVAMKDIAWRKGQSTDTSRDHELTDWAALARFVNTIGSTQPVVPVRAE
jgi:predicted CoA-binding protein